MSDIFRPARSRLGAAVLAGLIAFGAPATAATAAPAPSRFGPLTEPTTTDGDWARAEQWHVQALNLAGAWTYADGAGVTVAVLDSGVDAHHTDLEGQVLPGLDLVDTDGKGDSDPVGHGTTVSAIIAGRSDDTAGVVGIAPKSKILPIRVLDSENRYDDALTVAKGVRWAVDHGAKVLNLSLGGSGSSAALAAALDYAFAKDVVVIACTGNATASTTSENSGVWYPAREPGVVAVSGVERENNKLWSGSITGKETVITAPATQLLGARPDGYWKVQGTSFAAPMVAGTAALIRSRWPDMPAGEVVNRLIKTARDLGAPGRDPEFGFGLVDPVAALTADIPIILGNPLDTTPPQGVAKFGSAPASGQAQSAPEASGQPHAATRAPGPNAGGWASPTAAPATEDSHQARWIAILLFVISAIAAAVTIRRFARATG
ncbi:type VII secretion-associated serine protease mycosin [Actinoplanes sp. NPDC024001]|uniref:type VII secretion-associated serine protease mycosin n=1 Tax=Actinoplanes sp. NPDC024001 TaxID=3154598 RepID=UPI00340610DF